MYQTSWGSQNICIQLCSNSIKVNIQEIMTIFNCKKNPSLCSRGKTNYILNQLKYIKMFLTLKERHHHQSIRDYFWLSQRRCHFLFGSMVFDFANKNVVIDYISFKGGQKKSSKHHILKIRVPCLRFIWMAKKQRLEKGEGGLYINYPQNHSRNLSFCHFYIFWELEKCINRETIDLHKNK